MRICNKNSVEFLRSGHMVQQQDSRILLQKVAEGDQDALRALYEQYAQSIGLFVRRWLRDPTEAADIVHETMLVVWADAAKFEGRSSVKSWIFGIARFKALERNRSGARTETRDHTIDDNIASDDDDPTIPLDQLEDAAILSACLETLSDDHRRAIHLCFFEELPYAEISAIENCPVGTVKTRIMHAKRLLLRCVSGKIER